MPKPFSGPAGRAHARLRAWLARAWPRRAAPRPLPAVRRALPAEEDALIEALRRRIGPALRGAIARSTPRPRVK